MWAYDIVMVATCLAFSMKQEPPTRYNLSIHEMYSADEIVIDFITECLYLPRYQAGTLK